jgi:AraC-like DNA-binding protein
MDATRFAQKSDEILVRRAHRAPLLVVELEDLYTTSVASGADADIVTLAKKLGISARSLQRRLKSEGTSHRMLLAKARANAACSLLKSSDLTIDAVAKRVGFSERRAFERAFRRWTGHTPASYRRGGGSMPEPVLTVSEQDHMNE